MFFSFAVGRRQLSNLSRHKISSESPKFKEFIFGSVIFCGNSKRKLVVRLAGLLGCPLGFLGGVYISIDQDASVMSASPQ